MLSFRGSFSAVKGVVMTLTIEFCLPADVVVLLVPEI